MAVPAPLALDVVAAHRLVAGEDVLEHAREHVVGAGRTVGGRRSLVEAPGRRALPSPDRFGEHVALAPALEYSLLELGKRGVGVDGSVGWALHRSADSRQLPAARSHAPRLALGLPCGVCPPPGDQLANRITGDGGGVAEPLNRAQPRIRYGGAEVE